VLTREVRLNGTVTGTPSGLLKFANPTRFASGSSSSALIVVIKPAKKRE
jgi:hypothetical protein